MFLTYKPKYVEDDFQVLWADGDGLRCETESNREVLNKIEKRVTGFNEPTTSTANLRLNEKENEKFQIVRHT